MHASTITYDLVLTPVRVRPTVEPVPSPSKARHLLPATPTTPLPTASSDALTFSIDGQTFMLAEAAGSTLVRFQDGVLNDITFSEQIGSSPYRFSLMSTANYAFSYDNPLKASYGTFTAKVGPPSASPVTRAGLPWPSLAPA